MNLIKEVYTVKEVKCVDLKMADIIWYRQSWTRIAIVEFIHSLKTKWADDTFLVKVPITIREEPLTYIEFENIYCNAGAEYREENIGKYDSYLIGFNSKHTLQ